MTEGTYPRLGAPSPPELDVPLIDVLNELRIVQRECRQLRTQAANVAPTEVTLVRETGFTDITSRQDALTARMDRIENHLNVIGHDQC